MLGNHSRPSPTPSHPTSHQFILPNGSQPPRSLDSKQWSFNTLGRKIMALLLNVSGDDLDLLAPITEHSEALKRQLDELTGDPEMHRVLNDEESKLLLLLWEAKAKLFVQAVHHQAKNRPITDYKTIGARTGTGIKENIFKAQQTRKPAVKKYVKTFNRRYLDYMTKFPDQTLSDTADYPLTYEEFIEFPMDHCFWNDGLYYHSEAPWAIDANMQAAITATLTLSRVQEEFNLLAQELSQAIGWGIAYYNRLSDTVGHLCRPLPLYSLTMLLLSRITLM
ncbi:hypothetical protein MJO29_003127 [Puccinia striiformis f. sp. tritici]|nr:hypothetical protein MJO29_003127 [Puccinia striiformis f. sp. tritici]